MAKKNGGALLSDQAGSPAAVGGEVVGAGTLAPRPAGALAAPREPGALVEGRDSSISISRMSLFQGTAEEVQMYGEDAFKRGDFFDTLERANYGKSVKVIPVAGWMSWAKFIKGQKAPAYSVKNRSEVPPADLQWTGDGANKQSPAATECVNMILLVNGVPFPMLYMFKRTGLKAFLKVIEPMEARHAHSVYELGSEDDKNPEGKPFKRLTARFVMKSSDEQRAAVAALKNQIHSIKAQAEKLAETPDEGDGAATPAAATDDIPF